MEDLWDNLHHLREVYSEGAFVYDQHTRRYSEEDLIAKLWNERERGAHNQNG